MKHYRSYGYSTRFDSIICCHRQKLDGPLLFSFASCWSSVSTEITLIICLFYRSPLYLQPSWSLSPLCRFSKDCLLRTGSGKRYFRQADQTRWELLLRQLSVVCCVCHTVSLKNTRRKTLHYKEQVNYLLCPVPNLYAVIFFHETWMFKKLWIIFTQLLSCSDNS